MESVARGSALFADISGFTPLTEILANELGPQRGAEELAKNLNRLFEALVDDLHSFGGEVLYFSGDAITCWIDDDDGSRAAACGLRMQATIAEVGRVETPSGEDVQLAIKVAVAVGMARRFVVGDPSIQLIDVLAGRLIDHLAAAEQLAEKGDVLLDESALRSLGDRAVLSGVRSDRVNGRTCGVLEQLTANVSERPIGRELEPMSDDMVRQWVLPSVYERLAAGGSDFFAELRPAIPMFVRFGGIDFDDDPAAIEKLDHFIKRAQGIFAKYGGNVLQLTVGDKGAYLYAAFGAPRAHEDDAARAVSAARELQQLTADTEVTGIQIGIAGGRVFSGTYGHTTRRTFTCLGDAVNLAARLMSAASPGQVIVSGDVQSAAGDRFEWTLLPPLKLKGKAESVDAHRLEGEHRRTPQRHIRYPLPMVGREREMDAIMRRLPTSTAGTRQVVGITAEAGLGKSRLVAEFVREMNAKDYLVLFGEAEAIGQNTRYLSWRDVFRGLFGIDDDNEDDAQELVERQLADISLELVLRTPLMSNLLAVDIPDNEVTAAFDAKLRKTSLEGLAADVLRSKLATEPVVVVLEDCHWMDQASFDLLEVIVRETEDLPLLLLVAYRPEIEGDDRTLLVNLATFEEVVLGNLDSEDVERVIRSKLRQQFGDDVDPSDAAMTLIVDRGQGNPFYIEEIINYLARSDLDISDEDALSGFDLPDSLHALVLSRVDALAEEPRRTVKVASVIGREFDLPTLPGVYPELGAVEAVDRHLAVLADADLVTRNFEDDDSWLFRHAVTREVAYESMPFSIRTMLHESTGAYIERTEADALEVHLDLLAHHYWFSDNLDKKADYQRRAGHAAQAAYANESAIEYYERWASVANPAERPQALLKLGEVLELVGDWVRAESVEKEAAELALTAGDEVTVGWCEAALAEVARKHGRFEEVDERLGRAIAAFERHGEKTGKGRVLHLAGTIAAQRGDLDTAKQRYEESLQIRTELGDQAAMASLLSNLGIVAEYGGDFDASREFHERALEARTNIGDRWAIANSKTNLGMIAIHQDRFQEASSLFEEAMRLNREVGDTWHTALSHHNLGNAHRGLGDPDEARRQYLASAETYLAYGDRWAAAFLLEDIAVLAAMLGDEALALEFLGGADRMRAEIDATRGDALDEELRVRVIERVSLPDDEQAETRSRGSQLEFDVALARASEYLRT